MNVSGLLRRKASAVLVACALGMPGAAWSAVDGEIEPVGGTYDYMVNINNTNITNNQPGSTYTDTFDRHCCK
ncbi:hypothetical protein [Citrobacter sedlakii]|uniref:hypothetical protein n=1 Tax=Citrobacter sedlakii TaxID=67826 RepID=UPI00331522E9